MKIKARYLRLFTLIKYITNKFYENIHKLKKIKEFRKLLKNSFNLKTYMFTSHKFFLYLVNFC